MEKYKVFNIEFDGIDKTGKDSIMQQIFSYRPNKYIPKSRGLISQLAYSDIFNRDYVYEIDEGYIKNTLFVLLEVNEDDWNIRCDLTGEHKKNKERCDVEGDIKWKLHSETFAKTWFALKHKFPQYEDHFIRFNTSVETPISIIKQVVWRMDMLNKENDEELR